jgi:hypothetical protein
MPEITGSRLDLGKQNDLQGDPPIRGSTSRGMHIPNWKLSSLLHKRDRLYDDAAFGARHTHTASEYFEPTLLKDKCNMWAQISNAGSKQILHHNLQVLLVIVMRAASGWLHLHFAVDWQRRDDLLHC